METIGRLLNMGKNSAAMNMAIDEAILTAQKEQPNPTLRFYNWTSTSISVSAISKILTQKLT